MLNLSEQWKEAYAEYLQEQEERFYDDINEVCNELTEAQAEISKSFSLLEQYYSLTLEEGVLFEMKDDGKEGNANAGDSVTGGKDEGISSLMKELIKINSDTGIDRKDMTFQPVVTYTQQKVKDMGFFEGLIFFIGQLIKWIRNIVIYFIEKFKNLIRRLVGAKPVELDPSALKLDFTRAKKVEQISKSFDVGNANNIVKAWRIGPDELEKVNLSEASLAQILGIVKPDQEPDVRTDHIVVTMDLSRDIMNLKELMQHFYDLFDNAYGSNNEKLFASDDLKVILEMFKDTVARVKNGNLNTYSVGGVAVEAPGISSSAVKSNLITTNQNINALKEAYMKTSAKIQDITKVVQSKEMMMLSDMGVDMRLLSSSTYNSLKSILDTIPGRMKDASKMEKDLSKVQDKYNKLVKELSSMQQTVQSVSSVSYDTIYNKRLIDLLNAANWMSQLVSLRLAGLGLYIRELKDVRDAIVMLAGVNLKASEKRKLFK